MRINQQLAGALRRRRLLNAGLVLAVALTALLAGSGLPGNATSAVAAQASSYIDLNSASLEEVLQLPLPEDLARRIVDHRNYVRYFDNVYQLMEIEGMTAEIFRELKPLVATMPPPVEDASIARLSASYRQVQRYLGQEGSNEGLVDEYLDKMRSPENINQMDLYDLMSYQMVSPVDATNILKARQRLGRFESQRQLRRSEGLRYYSFRNLRDFVVFSDEEMQATAASGLQGYLQTRYWETPYSSDDEELGDIAKGLPRREFFIGETELYQPAWLNKIRVSGDGGFTAGVLTTREYGEQYWNDVLGDIDEAHVHETTYVRFRELSIGYTLPSKFFQNIFLDKVTVSFVGRNLALWSSYPNFDPETSTTGAVNGQGLEYVAFPQIASFGGKLIVSF